MEKKQIENTDKTVVNCFSQGKLQKPKGKKNPNEKICEAHEVQARKSTRRMPWHRKPTKDATSCEKLRGAANKPRSAGIRMGKPHYLKNSDCTLNT